MPARKTENQQIDKALYYLALDGVTRYGLAEAVKAVSQNKLGHPFFPEPPELRGLCDKAMEWPERQRERVRRQEAIERDRPAPRSAPSQSQRDRVAAIYSRFLAGYTDEKQSAEEAERAEIRARYGMTEEAVASIANQPVPSNFKKLGGQP
ncbi:hypothetical protein ASD64_01410 [Mesorhizobium sp. Root157]|nr:hypothetical protein ASD64_01410 [Mesorhizobium sp. Root157]